MSNRPALLFYCQHSRGIGHIVRSLALVEQLSLRFDVTLVSGGKLPRELRLPQSVNLFQLPPVGMSDDGQLISLDRRRSTSRTLQLRRTRLMELFEKLQPGALIIEFYPFGRMQFSSELLPVLDAVRKLKNSRPVVLCSLRDIIERKRISQQLFDDVGCALVNHLYDGVLFHADPRLARLEETFLPSMPLSIPVYYTGFVAPPAAPAPPGKKKAARVIVSAGGGRYGESLLLSALEGFTHHGIGEGIGMTIIAGPFLPQSEWQKLRLAATAIRGLKVKRWAANLRHELSLALASISQCGYNTAVDLLSTGIPALVVPYESPADQEQMNRARKLERKGVVRVMEMSRLNPDELAKEIRKTLSFRPRPLDVDLNGAANTAKLVEQLVLSRPDALNRAGSIEPGARAHFETSWKIGDSAVALLELSK